MLCSALVHGFTKSQVKSAKKMLEDYGPTPRICIDFVINPDSLVEYKDIFDKVSYDVSVDKVTNLFNRDHLDLDDASLTLTFLSRITGDDNLAQPVMDFPPSINTKFKQSLLRGWL